MSLPTWTGKDSPPNDEGFYWCYMKTNKQLEQGMKHYSKILGFNDQEVTHWMPLPEAPKTANNGNSTARGKEL
jgi:hypothetical protein